MGEVVDMAELFFSGDFSGDCTADPSARVPHSLLHINRRGFSQGCAFEGLVDKSHPIEELSSKKGAALSDFLCVATNGL
jgi:hypothetical protein